MTVSQKSPGCSESPISVPRWCAFWYHHTPADTVDKLDAAEVARCVAAMAIMAYVVADMEPTLPKEPAQSGG